MPPLGKVVIGLVLVVLDFRIDGFDVVPDVVGWVLVLAGLMPLSSRSKGLGAAAVAAAIGVLLALPQQVAEPGPVLRTLEAVVETVVVFGTCTGIRALVPDPGVRRTADRIRWADLAVMAVATAVGLGAGGDVSVDAALGAVLLVLVVVALAVAVWFLVFLWSVRQRPELAPGLRTADGPAPGTP